MRRPPNRPKPPPVARRIESLGSDGERALFAPEKLLIEIGYGYEQATKHRRPALATPPLAMSAR
jgi:hypothetical protein